MKRKLAVILSAIMILSLISVPVYANPAGEFDVDGNIIVLPHVFEVTLPTTAFTFVVDPEGVIGDNNAGAINFINGTPAFINRSSAPIQLGIEARITTASSGDTQVFPVAAANVGTAGATARNVNVALTPSTANVDEVGGSFGGTANATDLAVTPTLFRFVLPAAVYDIVGTVAEDNLRRVISDTPNLQGTQIRLAGQVTPNPAIWTGNEEFSVNVRFSFNTVPAGLPAVMAGSAHLRQIQTETEIFDTMEVGPSLSATATITGSPNVITITAVGFEFPTTTTGWSLRGLTGAGAESAIGSATFQRVNATEARVMLNAGWSSGGASQTGTTPTWFELTAGDYVIRINKVTANANDVASVTVTPRV